jgi:tRNA (guanine37-N1)-methyltransferase
MVLKPEPVVSAVETLLEDTKDRNRARVILLSPSGYPLTQSKVEELAQLDRLVLICGRYEGVDERVSQLVVDEELSIGDYVMQGGEVGAMVIVEAVARLIPGVLGKQESVEEETFQDGLLEYPHYTRPREFRGLEVPETLLGGDHAAIAKMAIDRIFAPDFNPSPRFVEPVRFAGRNQGGFGGIGTRGKVKVK